MGKYNNYEVFASRYEEWVEYILQHTRSGVSGLWLYLGNKWVYCYDIKGRSSVHYTTGFYHLCRLSHEEAGNGSKGWGGREAMMDATEERCKTCDTQIPDTYKMIVLLLYSGI